MNGFANMNLTKEEGPPVEFSPLRRPLPEGLPPSAL